MKEAGKPAATGAAGVCSQALRGAHGSACPSGKTASELDQFFTKPAVARKCWQGLRAVLPALTKKEIGDLFFIEPSAGDGVFYDLLPAGEAHRIGVDIAPRRAEFIAADFLTMPFPRVRAAADTVIVGNPPFGRRGELAVQFFNRGACLADTIAFIVPVIFRKHFIHKKLPHGWRWIKTIPLARDAFWTAQKSTYAVNTEFQIWTRLPSCHQDHRLFHPPPLAHADFEFWQYNNTREALKVFDNPFEFAVPCQGWQDYNRRPEKESECEKHKQWMLFKPKNARVRRQLLKINYRALALKNTTSTPGFRKADLVQEYMRLYG